MNEKLFRTALRYIEKGYSLEDLRFSEDLLDLWQDDIDLCIEYYWSIIQHGTNWAYEELETLNK